MAFHLGHRSELDGIRAIAVGAVVAGHFHVPYLERASLGVEMFFVLSGFLITSILMEEGERHGGIAYRKFYTRRALRLLPALWTLLVVWIGYNLIAGNDMSTVLVGAATSVLYITNWTGTFGLIDDYASLSHTWSLGIEEQFYLVWPPALVALGIRRLRRPLTVVLGLVVLAMVVRAGLAAVGTENRLIYYNALLRADQLLIGCALALAVRDASFWGWVERHAPTVRRAFWPAIGILLVTMLPPFADRSVMFSLGGYTFNALLTAVVLLALITPGEPALMHRVLRLRPVAYVGLISYGIYLWHFPVITAVRDRTDLRLYPEIAVGLAITLCAAAASRRWIEAPFLRRKDRFSVVPVDPPPRPEAPSTVPDTG